MKKISIAEFFSRTRFICVIFILICASSNLKAQMVYMPDSMFRVALTNQGYASCIVGDSIDSSCPIVSNATLLNISSSNIYDLQGVQAFTNLLKLNCDSNNLITIPTLPASLDTLYCSSNFISSLPSLPNFLKYLICSSNQLTTLPIIDSSLTWLGCGSNQLTALPNLPNSLLFLSCEWNQLSSLPVLPSNLRDLACNNNHLTTLPSLPSGLWFIGCQANQLVSLPNLPNSLQALLCSGNQLTNLTLPSSLLNLDCSSNPLNVLPVLPNGLLALYCYYDNLTNLPTLPSSLTVLSCGNNQLINLPVLPNALTYLSIENNQLVSLPELPDSSYYLNCNNNPNLFCLPQLKRIVILDFSFTGITCLPNYGNVTNSNPLLSSIPLCGLFNPNGCNVLWNINGKSYFDENADCSLDSIDIRQRNMHIMLYQNGNLTQQVFTGGEGYYSFDTNDTAYYQVKLDTTNIPFSVLCPASMSYNDTLTVTDSLFNGNDFSLTCKTGFDVGIWSIEGHPFRPAHYTTVYVNAGDIANFYGAHCASGVSGSVTMIINGSASYVSQYSGALTPSSISGDSIVYNIADFGNLNLFTAFNIIVQTDSNAVIGTQVCFTVNVTPTSGDNDTSNNTLTHCFTVVGSFDPNEKEVDPANDIDYNGNRWLTYTIHFQNTGTSAADYIYITDTLDANLDLSTFQLLAYSHQPLVQILDGGIARFNFPNINLPDSGSNEPASHGYVQYKMKFKNNLSIGSQIRNTAYIYFDFNSPVATNTTLNNVIHTSIAPVANNKLQFSVYPNPSHGEFTVSCSQFTSENKIELRVFDVIGKELVFSVMNDAKCQLRTSNLPSGIYFLQIETTNGMMVKKLVKE